MKQFSLSIIAGLLILNVNCGNSGSAKNSIPRETFAEIKFKTLEGDMGKIPAKGKSDINFTFFNTGDAPLTLTEVRGTCHCIYTDWSKTPVNPGDSSVIKVTFDPEGIVAFFIRTVIVRSNAKTDSLQLKISGEALADPK